MSSQLELIERIPGVVETPAEAISSKHFISLFIGSLPQCHQNDLFQAALLLVYLTTSFSLLDYWVPNHLFQ